MLARKTDKEVPRGSLMYIRKKLYLPPYNYTHHYFQLINKLYPVFYCKEDWTQESCQLLIGRAVEANITFQENA